MENPTHPFQEDVDFQLADADDEKDDEETLEEEESLHAHSSSCVAVIVVVVSLLAHIHTWLGMVWGMGGNAGSQDWVG